MSTIAATRDKSTAHASSRRERLSAGLTLKGAGIALGICAIIGVMLDHQFDPTHSFPAALVIGKAFWGLPGGTRAAGGHGVLGASWRSCRARVYASAVRATHASAIRTSGSWNVFGRSVKC